MNKLLILSLLALSACATNQNKAEKIDTTMTLSKEVTTNTSLGVKNGDMVVQKKVFMSEELRRIQIDAYELEAKVYGGHRYYDNRGYYGVLQDCYLERAQASGEIIPMPEKREYVIPDEVYTKIGIDEKDSIVGLTEEYLKDRIARFQTYKKILIDRASDYDVKVKQCHLQLAVK